MLSFFFLPPFLFSLPHFLHFFHTFSYLYPLILPPKTQPNGMSKQRIAPPFYREQGGKPWDANSWHPLILTCHPLIFSMGSHGLRSEK